MVNFLVQLFMMHFRLLCQLLLLLLLKSIVEFFLKFDVESIHVRVFDQNMAVRSVCV